jgi:hypothetical protein
MHIFTLALILFGNRGVSGLYGVLGKWQGTQVILNSYRAGALPYLP